MKHRYFFFGYLGPLLVATSLASVACNTTDPGSPDGPSVSAGAGANQPSDGPLDGCSTDTIATNLVNPQKLVLRNNAFYTLESSADLSSQLIVRRDATGLNRTTIVEIGSSGGLSDFDVDATAVYWSSPNGTLLTAPLAGGGVQSTTLFAQPIVHLTLDDHAVYWTSADGYVRSRALAGGDIVDLYTPDSKTFSTDQILVDSGFVYWSETASDGGTVKRAPVGGGPAVDLLTERGTFGSAIVDDLMIWNGNAYALAPGNSVGFGNGTVTGNGSIIEIPLGESVLPRFIATDLAFPRAMAGDDTGLYVGGITSFDIGDDLEAPPVNRLRHGVLEVVAPSSSLSDVVLCPGGVCWVNANTGTLMRYNECKSP